ncbi:MAG: T9SS type A sorting domain-containing protein [Bacteroidetes bacterium]|nr:T9SS type A sorting domain-containing protein [Bacteroidota bacterium]
MKFKLLFAFIICACIVHAQVSVSLVSASASCLNPCNGALTFSASGGTPPYTYALAPATQLNTSGVFTGVCGTSYTVTVADLFGNTATYSGSLTLVTPALITGVTTAAVGPPFDYLATVNYTGGVAPYYVTWVRLPFNQVLRTDTVSSMNDTLSGLPPGEFNVTVTDSANTAMGCTQNTTPIPFSICDANAGTGTITIIPNDTVCSGDQIIVSFIPSPNGPVIPMAQTYFSDNPNCDPSSSVTGSYSCNITQTTIFGGFWIYGLTCTPVVYPPLTVTVMPCTGIHSYTSVNAISVFPNPSNRNFTVRTNETKAIPLEIFDETGRICFSAMVTDGEKIETSLPAGIYSCRFEKGNEANTVKLVVVL